MVHCYKHVIESTEVVHQLVGGSSNTSFQLNKHQCQILAQELVETRTFLEKKSTCSKFDEVVECIILRHLCSSIKRAEILVKKCCCKNLESWLVSAMMLVEIQEEFMAIILDIHLWRMLLDFTITCGRGLSREKKVEKMKIMDEECHQLFKDLCRESHALQQAAIEDKRTIISRTLSIVNLHGSTNSLDYLRAIYLQSWLTSSIGCRHTELTKYEYVNVLGQGGCGTVLKVKWLGVECALKVLGGQDEKEATALKGLFHPNIIRLFHYWEDGFENPQSCLLMELMPKDLGAYMKGLPKGMPFSLHVAIDIMYQIAQAMRYMHDKHLIHRDLKPANILVKERPQMGLSCIDGVGYLDIKLADFGLVKSYNNTSTFQTHSKNKGTGMYRAPEIIRKDMIQKRHYLPMVDVWSFGITCAEILSGKEAYVECVDKSALDIQIMICKEGLRPTLPKHCPQYLAFCIKSCWEFLPSRRPTFASICKLLRHAKLLSLGVTKLDDSKVFFAYTTQNDQVQSLNLSSSSSTTRVSTFFQSSLKFMGIGPRRVPSVAEVLPAAADLHEERVVSTPIVTEESPLANEDVAGSVAILANPTQKVKSFPDLQGPVQLTQASLDNAISPPNASDPIQPAIIPRKKFRRKILTAKADGGKLTKTPLVNPAKIFEIKENKEEALTSRENFLKNHPRQKNKKPGRTLSDIQEWIESKGTDPELPKFQTSMSTSNRPWKESFTLPKLRPPDDWLLTRRSTASLSSTRGDRCNDSREAGGYQFRALPPGYYRVDDTEPSPKKLRMAVRRVKAAVNHFAKVLVTNMNKHPVELDYLKQTILWEVKADVDRANRWKFLVQAFICERLFDGFDAPNGYFGVEYLKNDQMTKLISFALFSAFKNKASTISMLLDSDSPDDSFLGRFCIKKFKSIFGQPSPIYQEEWDAIERECHPKTMFYQSFLKVAVSVWLVHRLVHSFEEKVEMLIYENGAKFQRQTMESVVPGSYEEEDEEADENTEVDFSVIPGFQVSRSVVKCEVYLRSRNRHHDVEITGRISTEKTPVKTLSNEPLGKTLSAKTSGTLHSPELPVRDNNGPRSLQPPKVLSSSSGYMDHYPPARVGDDGSSGLADTESSMFLDTQREGLIPGNQGSVSRKNKYEQDNFSETFRGSHGDGTTVYKMPAPSSRSSNQRGPQYAVRVRKVSTRRRRTNTRRSFPSV